MRSLRAAALAVALLPVLASEAASQITPLPRTGCQNAVPMKWAGSAQIGSRIDFYPPDPVVPTVFEAGFFMLGLPQGPMAPLSFGCTLNCRLGFTPTIAVPEQGECFALEIPPAPALVGLTLGVQHLRIEVPLAAIAATACARLSVAYAVTIQK